jgi:glycine cleavage system H protein
MKKIDHYLVRTDVYYQPENHLWLEKRDDVYRMGLSPLMQETSGTFVAILFAEKNKSFQKDESLGSLEAEKHVGHIKAPVSCRIIRINDAVVENPGLINKDPYGEGWLLEVAIENEDELNDLISGEDAITTWFQEEVQKYDVKGWIAK